MKRIITSIVAISSFLLVFSGFAVLAYWISHEDHEARLAKMLIDADGKIAQAYFTPDDDIRSVLLSLIANERRSIQVAIYTLTEKAIAQELIKAAQRGVRVECVVDKSYGQDRYSKVSWLSNDGIPVWVYQTSNDERSMALMHDKFVLFEDNVDHRRIVWTGSYNFTQRASTRNRENVVILDSAKLWKLFSNQFVTLKLRSIQISGKIQNSQRTAQVSESTWLKKLSRFFDKL